MIGSLISSIRERYQHVLSQIASPAIMFNRLLGAVRVIVVSKSQPLEVLKAAFAAGISRFGENYAQEAVEKIITLGETSVEWHMIRYMQGRKAEQVAANFSMLHSLNSLQLAARLDRFCSEGNRRLPVLLEFNVSGEESKFGFPAWNESRWSNLEPEIEEI